MAFMSGVNREGRVPSENGECQRSEKPGRAPPDTPVCGDEWAERPRLRESQFRPGLCGWRQPWRWQVGWRRAPRWLPSLACHWRLPEDARKHYGDFRSDAAAGHKNGLMLHRKVMGQDQPHTTWCSSTEQTVIPRTSGKCICRKNEKILLANLLQSSRSTFSRGSLLSFSTFKEGMWSTPISVLEGCSTVSEQLVDKQQ